MYVDTESFATSELTVCLVFLCRSFVNNLKTYKLLAHRKPETELPTVSRLMTS